MKQTTAIEKFKNLFMPLGYTIEEDDKKNELIVTKHFWVYDKTNTPKVRKYLYIQRIPYNDLNYLYDLDYIPHLLGYFERTLEKRIERESGK